MWGRGGAGWRWRRGFWGGAGRSVAVQSSVPARLSLSPFPSRLPAAAAPTAHPPPPSFFITHSYSLALRVWTDPVGAAATAGLGGGFGGWATQTGNKPFSPQTSTGGSGGEHKVVVSIQPMLSVAPLLAGVKSQRDNNERVTSSSAKDEIQMTQNAAARFDGTKFEV